MLSVKDIQREEKNKQKVKMKLYERVFQQVLLKIKTHIKSSNEKFIIYEVPITIPFERLYNPIECIDYIKQQLEPQFNKIDVINNRYIYISWKFDDKNNKTIVLKGSYLSGASLRSRLIRKSNLS